MVKKAGNGIERGDRMQASWTAAFLDPSMCFFLPFFFFYAVLSLPLLPLPTVCHCDQKSYCSLYYRNFSNPTIFL
jgi:hypothetical protein